MRSSMVLNEHPEVEPVQTALHSWIPETENRIFALTIKAYTIEGHLNSDTVGLHCPLLENLTQAKQKIIRQSTNKPSPIKNASVLR